MHEKEIITESRKAFWHNRRVFVTGGFGLLGSTVVDFLVKMGAWVVVLKRDHVPTSRLFETESFG